MDAIILVFVTFTAYIVAYNTYGRFLARKIFNLKEENLTPSNEFNDGKDFVPTKKWVIFGHHYTSIAGTGPIVGLDPFAPDIQFAIGRFRANAIVEQLPE